jgi:hypothetical protein
MSGPQPGSAAYKARYGKAEPVPEPKLKDLDELLTESGLEPLKQVLADSTLSTLNDSLVSDRVAFLTGLKESGVDKLGDRQKLANALGKAKRLDRF